MIHSRHHELEVFGVAVAGSAGVSAVVATGPFCSKENALYEPLQALLDHCRQQPPDVLILLGPFIDAQHPQVQDGTLAETFENTFKSQVLITTQRSTLPL